MLTIPLSATIALVCGVALPCAATAFAWPF